MSSHAAAALNATTSNTKTQRGAPSTIQTKRGMPMAAVSARLPSVAGSPGNSAAVIATTPPTSHPTEATLPAVKVGDRTIQLQRPEIGPQGGRDPQLGIGDLPEQEVRDAHLPAGADEEIGIGNSHGVERVTDVVLGDVLGGELAGPHLASESTERVEELVAAAIVEGQHQVEPAVVLRLAHHALDPATDRERHAVRAADDAQAHVARHELRQLPDDRFLEQPHQRGHLVLRSRPVLG